MLLPTPFAASQKGNIDGTTTDLSRVVVAKAATVGLTDKLTRDTAPIVPVLPPAGMNDADKTKTSPKAEGGSSENLEKSLCSIREKGLLDEQMPPPPEPKFRLVRSQAEKMRKTCSVATAAAAAITVDSSSFNLTTSPLKSEEKKACAVAVTGVDRKSCTNSMSKNADATAGVCGKQDEPTLERRSFRRSDIPGKKRLEEVQPLDDVDTEVKADARAGSPFKSQEPVLPFVVPSNIFARDDSRTGEKMIRVLGDFKTEESANVDEHEAENKEEDDLEEFMESATATRCDQRPQRLDAYEVIRKDLAALMGACTQMNRIVCQLARETKNGIESKDASATPTNLQNHGIGKVSSTSPTKSAQQHLTGENNADIEKRAMRYERQLLMKIEELVHKGLLGRGIVELRHEEGLFQMYGERAQIEQAQELEIAERRCGSTFFCSATVGQKLTTVPTSDKREEVVAFRMRPVKKYEDTSMGQSRTFIVANVPPVQEVLDTVGNDDGRTATEKRGVMSKSIRTVFVVGETLRVAKLQKQHQNLKKILPHSGDSNQKNQKNQHLARFSKKNVVARKTRKYCKSSGKSRLTPEERLRRDIEISKDQADADIALYLNPIMSLNAIQKRMAGASTNIPSFVRGPTWHKFGQPPVADITLPSVGAQVIRDRNLSLKESTIPAKAYNRKVSKKVEKAGAPLATTPILEAAIKIARKTCLQKKAAQRGIFDGVSGSAHLLRKISAPKAENSAQKDACERPGPADREADTASRAFNYCNASDDASSSASGLYSGVLTQWLRARNIVVGARKVRSRSKKCGVSEEKVNVS
ncbi:unnamed protein product [Amoebophrya sp. A25]|nr:unnamed protein product [Amoebophrya sp. A25]|eukprot:GSA25T00001201001.1